MTVSFYNCVQINTVSKSPNIRPRLRSEGGKISVVLQRDILPVAAKQATSTGRLQPHGCVLPLFQRLLSGRNAFAVQERITVFAWSGAYEIDRYALASQSDRHNPCKAFAHPGFFGYLSPKPLECISARFYHYPKTNAPADVAAFLTGFFQKRK